MVFVVIAVFQGRKQSDCFMVSRCFFAKQEGERNFGLTLFQKYQLVLIL